jgi:hypothetical protein
MVVQIDLELYLGITCDLSIEFLTDFSFHKKR